MKRGGRMTAIGVIAVVNLVIGSWAGYGLYSRSGDVRFSKGGTFSPLPSTAASPEPAARAARATTSAVPRAADAASGARAPAPSPSKGAAATTAARTAPARPTLPRAGTYVYDGRGREQADYSFASACGWSIDRVTAVVRHGPDGVIFDWTYSEERRQRHLDDYASSGIYTTFIGAIVECAKVRNTSEANYTPPALRVPFPLQVGKTWSQTTRTEERTERLRGRVVTRRTVAVPAGRFDAYQVRIDGTISDGQDGTFWTTFWYAPALGVYVQQETHLDVRSGQARFVSDITIELRARP